MSYSEAVEDNILVHRGGKGHSSSYYPPCHICKAPVYSWSYIRGTQYTCADCRTELAQMMREESNDTLAGKKKKKLQHFSKITQLNECYTAVLNLSCTSELLLISHPMSSHPQERL